MSFYICLQICAMTIQLGAPIYHSLVRMTFYFYIPVITLAIPFFISTMGRKVDRAVSYFIVFSFAIYMMKMIYSYNPETRTNLQGVIPYVFIDTPFF